MRIGGPLRPLLLFAPGAGAPSSHPWMRAWAERLAAVGEVVPFDYAYARAGRRLPDRLPALIAAHRAALAAARAGRHGPVVLVGKSMGGRVGCHVAIDEPDVAAMVCLGFPLVGAGKRRPLRDEVLIATRAPILLVQGTRDRLAPLDVLAGVRARMTAPNELYVVEGGDHDLRLRRADERALGRTQADSDAAVLAAIARFVAART